MNAEHACNEGARGAAAASTPPRTKLPRSWPVLSRCSERLIATGRKASGQRLGRSQLGAERLEARRATARDPQPLASRKWHPRAISDRLLQ